MNLLNTKWMGTEVQGVELHGDPNVQCEPAYFRIALPCGDVEVSRVNVANGPPEYWVHVRVNRPEDGGDWDDERKLGTINDARVDVVDKQGGHAEIGD